jgi:small subunit ribosomal protein S4e
MDGTFSLPKRIELTVNDKKIEIPADIIMVIGKEKPVIKVR